MDRFQNHYLFKYRDKFLYVFMIVNSQTLTVYPDAATLVCRYPPEY